MLSINLPLNDNFSPFIMSSARLINLNNKEGLQETIHTK